MKNEIIKIDDKVLIKDDTKDHLIEDVNFDNINEICESENYIEQIDLELLICDKKTDKIYKNKLELLVSTAIYAYLGILVYVIPAISIGLPGLITGSNVAQLGLFSTIVLPACGLFEGALIHRFKKKFKKLNIEEGKVDSLAIYLKSKKEKEISKLKSLREKSKVVTTDYKEEKISKDNLDNLSSDIVYYTKLINNPVERDTFYSSITPIKDMSEYITIDNSLEETIKQKKLTLLPREK